MAQVHSEVGGFHDTKTLDADSRVRRKEKKKKPKKVRLAFGPHGHGCVAVIDIAR